MRILTINAGSTSLKVERYDLTGPLPPIDTPAAPTASAEPDAAAEPQALADAMHDPVDAVMHRFVQLPADAAAVTRLDADERARIAAAGVDDPLHDRAALQAVELLDRIAPAIPQFAVSDSSFHRTMPAAATTYALPRDVTGTALHRIGYHGLSHEYAAHRACAIAGCDVRSSRVITAHLGGGSSLCAVRDGASIDTTMGFTPLEGVPMATRSGSVDPGLLVHLLRGGMTTEALAHMLEHESGLLGISGLSGDLRELLAATDNPQARLAIDVLGWRLRSAFGAMLAVLGGVDVIAFTGGIGEHAPSIRAAALEGGLGIGVSLDPAANATAREGCIESPGSGARVVVVSAREGWQLARIGALALGSAHE